MTDEEILRRINDAIEAISQFQRKYKAGTLIEQKIEKSTDMLIKEAYLMGPAGKVCPACGGSGRSS